MRLFLAACGFALYIGFFYFVVGAHGPSDSVFISALILLVIAVAADLDGAAGHPRTDTDGR